MRYKSRGQCIYANETSRGKPEILNKALVGCAPKPLSIMGPGWTWKVLGEALLHSLYLFK